MTTKLAIFSDLHFEHDGATPDGTWLDSKTLEAADVVVLAGDISTTTVLSEHLLRVFAPHQIVGVAGNHEHYGHELESNLLAASYAYYKSGGRLLEHKAVELAGVRFVGCTLWTDYELYGDADRAMDDAALRLNDHRLIRIGDQRFTPAHARHIHLKSKRWLEQQFAVDFDGPTVVVTHHAPSRKSIHPRYDEDILSAAFASDLDGLVLEHQPELWIHGHTHNATDYFIGDTRVICNPRGYPRERMSNGFRADLLVEV